MHADSNASMQILTKKLHSIISTWAFYIAPADFSSKEPLSCFHVLTNIYKLVDSLAPRTASQFESLLKNIRDNEKKLAYQDKQLQLHLNNMKQNDFNNSYALLSSFVDIENPEKSAKLLQKHLTKTQLTLMEQVNLCDLAMAGTRTLSPNQQKVFLLSSPQRKISPTETDSLTRYVNWCERLSKLVSSTVLSDHKNITIKDRSKILTILTNTAIRCIKVGDFCSAMAIWSGLSISPITRLSKCWKKVDKCKNMVIEHIFDPNKNFQNYRAAVRHTAVNNQQSILVPSMSLLLKDLLYLTKKAADREASVDVLIERWCKLTTPVIRFRQWTLQGLKTYDHRIKFNERLLTLIKISPQTIDNDDMEKESFLIEKAQNKWEKTQLKMLKNLAKPDKRTVILA